MLSKIIQWDVIKSLLLHISKCIDPMFQNMQSLESVHFCSHPLICRTEDRWTNGREHDLNRIPMGPCSIPRVIISTVK